MTLDSTNALWMDASARVRASALENTPPVVLRRATELIYDRALTDAASKLVDRIQQNEGQSND